MSSEYAPEALPPVGPRSGSDERFHVPRGISPELSMPRSAWIDFI
jgi:hypothetical protein